MSLSVMGWNNQQTLGLGCFVWISDIIWNNPNLENKLWES